MKNLKSLLTGFALILISGAVLATGNLKVNVVPAGEDKTTIEISDVAENNYEIELRNENGDIVFYKKTNAPSKTYIRNYDFSMLNDGDYRLTVNTNNEKLENSLKVKKGLVESTNQRRVAEPFFTVNDNRLELSYLNFEQEDVKVMIYKNNRLLFDKDLKPEFAVNYAVDLSSLRNGTYDAVLVTSNNFFEYQIDKK